MPNTLFEGLVRTRSCDEIYLKIIANTRITDNCLLIIPGDMGYGFATIEPWAMELYKRLPNTAIILFDPLECGKSRRAVDPSQEFTLDNFSEIAAQMVEIAADKLQIVHMNLSILSSSFGSMTAYNLPKLRPTWTESESAIQLDRIITVSGPTSWHSLMQSVDFVEEHYGEDINCENYVNALMAIYSGRIKTKKELINHLFVTLAPVYADNLKNFPHAMLGYLLKNHPNNTTQAMGFFSIFSHNARLTHESLAGCSLDVFNHFFSNKFNKFDLETTIETYPYYRKIKFCFIAGINDPIADPRTNSNLVMDKLPLASQIIFNAKHSIFADGLQSSVCEVISYLLLNEHALLENHLRDRAWAEKNRLVKGVIEPLDNPYRLAIS